MARKRSWTGERLETTITSEVMLEHLHRYALATEICKNKKVLDIACGEGYGCNLISKLAAEVTGIDIDETTINNASKKYFDKKIRFIKGSILDIPADNGYFDLITCFETLEHVSNHEKAMSELKRALHPEGILLISTPNKYNYSDKTGYKNPYHLKELYKDEFHILLKSFFKEVKLLGQCSHSMSMIINEEKTQSRKYYSGDYNSINSIPKPELLYWVALASDYSLPDVNNTLFLHPHTISRIQEETREYVKQTITYRVGNAILFPFKLLKKLFSK